VPYYFESSLQEKCLTTVGVNKQILGKATSFNVFVLPH
jgi:hypothetical protein